MYDTTEIPQARSTDPLTSKLAAARVNYSAVRNLILHHLQMNGPSDVWQISHATGIKETTVSSQMKPLLRLGHIHKEGMRPSEETGRYRIVWAFGPSADEHDPMAQLETGPQQKLKLRLFEKSEVIRILQSTQQEGDVFQNLTNALNTELSRRVY